MKSGTITGRLPVGKLAKRLPIGGRKKGLARVLDSVPTPKRLPGGTRAAGTAGGLLLGVGAAVAANQAVKGMGRREQNDESGTTEAGKGTSKDAPAKAKTDDKATKADKSGAKREEERSSDEGGKKKGLLGSVGSALGKVFKRGGKGGGGKKVKLTNIVEYVDVGAPRRLVYDQFTQFQDFPSFMKKVESVDQVADEKLHWKAKIFWSARTWESTIVEQVPDRHIVWRSKGSKGHVDGTVSFHELAPNLTRVLVNLEYHPQGLFERTGNLWRAQGRRVRLELKHFRRHVMTQSLLKADEIEGWRGEIRDSEVVKSHEDALAEEEKAGAKQENVGKGRARSGNTKPSGTREEDMETATK
ncbi:SRPBCC family protein [Actinomadura kijaniata]|uniref:SRPBCC family protein n=1 Tax=Actinomadura kijaniata TaxID=46161 RepID=UPI000AF7990D|nr:SRPBCC family protein [Actinomadura kijaniata]